MKTIAAILVLAPAALAAIHTAGHVGAHASLRKDSARGFVRALAFEFKLRICNAYPSDEKLTISKGKDDLNKDDAIAYQNCVDLEPDLKAGDKLDFKMDGSEAGTFTITDLPQNDATLLLVVHRHDVESTTVSFESHVFANLANSQIAVIDSYTGTSKSVVKIQDHKESKDSKAMPRQEELRYSSVVAVNPGDYECVLYDEAGKEKSTARLVALTKESYIVLRTGVEDKKKPYPQELVVYPKSDDPNKSGAVVPFVFNGLLLATVGTFFSLQ